jgi:hypothetical protein
MTESANFQDVVRKVFIDRALSSLDTGVGGALRGEDAIVGWRLEAHRILLKNADQGGVLVLASEVVAPLNSSVIEQPFFRHNAFETMQSLASAAEKFQLGAISCMVAPERSGPWMLSKMLDDYPSCAVEVCKAIAVDTQRSPEARETALEMLLETDGSAALSVARLLDPAAETPMVRSSLDRIHRYVPADAKPAVGGNVEMSPELLDRAMKLAAVIIDAKLSAAEASRKVHELAGDTFVAYACDLAIYRDKARTDRRDALKQLVANVPDLAFLLSN